MDRLTIPKGLLIINLLSFLLLVFYVYHTNRNATMGYILKELQEEREELLNEKEMLNLKTSKVQSLSNLENDPYIANMNGYLSVVYIDKDIKVAVKK